MQKKTETYRTDWNGHLLEIQYEPLDARPRHRRDLAYIEVRSISPTDAPPADRKNRLLQTYSACIDYHRRGRPRRLHRRDAGGQALSINLKVMALQYRLSGSESPEFHPAVEWYPTVMDLRTVGCGDFLSLSIAQSRDC